jgi:hypothetical protein
VIRRAVALAALACFGAGVVALAATTGPEPVEQATVARRSAPSDAPNARFFAAGPLFAVTCDYARSDRIDPIVSPGQPGVSHRHDFFGNEAVEASSTGASLVGADTTCRHEGDTASYWAPSLLRDGEPVAPMHLTAYYRVAPGVDPAEVEPFPLGLAAIAGDGDAASAQPTSVVAWACGRGGAVSATPPRCDTGEPLQLRVTFPDCWDGEHLDSADHRAHLAYSGPDGCSDAHPVPLPRLTLVIAYPVWGDPSTLELASGPPITAHADFLNGWSESALATEVDACLNNEVVCGIPDSTRTGRNVGGMDSAEIITGSDAARRVQPAAATPAPGGTMDLSSR